MRPFALSLTALLFARRLVCEQRFEVFLCFVHDGLARSYGDGFAEGNEGFVSSVELEVGPAQAVLGEVGFWTIFEGQLQVSKRLFWLGKLDSAKP